jgi:ornithine racemase
MSILRIKIPKIVSNIKKINKFLADYDKKWTLVMKVLAQHQESLKIILNHPCINEVHSVANSRLSGLQIMKEANPDLRTMYIKPPAINHAERVVRLADISLNTSYPVLEALDAAAKKLGKVHQVVIMIELGELREGIIRENIDNFYRKLSKLKHIKVIGIGTNLGCMYGIEPTYDKLIQLSLYRELLESKYEMNLELVSGGSSITLPLVTKNTIPPAVNHFRIGEAAFFGVIPGETKKFRDLTVDTFEFAGYIIELEKKPSVPDGNLTDASVGVAATDGDEEKETYRAILNFGILDVDMENIIPKNPRVQFAGTTSDMTVFDLGDNRNKDGKPMYKVGDQIRFKTNYMGVARLMNSHFVEFELID